jgi:hypothetical protein
MLGVGTGDEHRLARVAGRLEPGACGAVRRVDLEDLLDPSTRTVAVAPDVAIWALVAASVVCRG